MNEPSTLSQVLGFAGFLIACVAGWFAVALVVSFLLGRLFKKTPSLVGKKGSANPPTGEGTNVPGVASTPTPGVIPKACRLRGHDMRLVSEHPRKFACANDGCPITATVHEKWVPITHEHAARLLNPATADDAYQELLALAANTPTREEVLDTAVEDFRAELSDVEAWANGGAS